MHAALDPAEAHETIARHVGVLARRALRSVGGDDDAAVVRQVELANRIAPRIAALAPAAADARDLVAEAKDLL